MKACTQRGFVDPLVGIVVSVLPVAWGLLVAGLLAGEPAPARRSASQTLLKKESIRGMTISCRGNGVQWGSEAMVRSMASLKSLGVKWIAIHPYAGIRQDGQVFHWRGLGLDEPPIWITRPIAEAHRMGLKIMIKPHIGYWGSGFSWRGAITFDEEEEWQRFFADYQRWVARLAEICSDADLFVVGTELEKTISHAEEWRGIIRAVRDRFHGPITYAANWSGYQDVPFWNQLDAIGIQAYFPILPSPGAAEERGLPGHKKLAMGWQRIVAEVRRFGAKVGKKTLFTELGYNRSSQAPYRPWDYRVGGSDAEEIQRRCLAAALHAIEQEESILGVFLWKWFPGDRPARNFCMSTPAMRRVIAEAWHGERSKKEEF